MSITQYSARNVLWGRELPRIMLYDTNWRLISEWRFSKYDNFRMEIKCQRLIDAEGEMESGILRQRIRGYRLFIEFSVNNIENRDLMLFLRRTWAADHIIVVPHYGSMLNPNDNSHNFEVLIDSDFEPEYFDGRFIGHAISWTFKSKDLMIDIPRDSMNIMIIPATTKVVGGIEVADDQTSMTYPSEKMVYGGWEVSEEDFRQIAYVETPPDGEEDPYGALP